MKNGIKWLRELTRYIITQNTRRYDLSEGVEQTLQVLLRHAFR